MKNLICFLMLAACIALFASCGKDSSFQAADPGDEPLKFTFEIEYEYEANGNPSDIEKEEKYTVKYKGDIVPETDPNDPVQIPDDAFEMNVKISQWNPTCIMIGTKQYCF